MTDKKILIIFTISVLFLLWIFLGSKNISFKLFNKSLGISVSSSLKPAHPYSFFDEASFIKGINQTRKENRLSPYRIQGGIIPHHTLPGFILADFFYRLVAQKPETIILIGPNHSEKGKFNALTSTYRWETPFGIVEPNETVINELVKKDILRINESVLSSDHSAVGIMPYIKYYLPEAKVIPVLLSNFTTQQESEIMADNLKDIMRDDFVLITAVDFSHYLINKKAEENDVLTLEIIKNYDYRQLFTLSNAYVDSPPSVGIFLMVMKKFGAANMDILYHTSSGELQRDDFIETTSYFSIAYYR